MDHIITTPDNLSTIEDPAAALTAIDDQLRPVWVERQRLAAIVAAIDQTDTAGDNINTALGREMGDPWIMPPSHLPYTKGWEVEHKGAEWISDIGANVWEPGLAGWRKKPTEPGGAAEWEQPSGAGGYDEDNRVIFEGHIWRSTFAGKNVWSPTAYPAAWVDEGPA